MLSDVHCILPAIFEQLLEVLSNLLVYLTTLIQLYCLYMLRNIVRVVKSVKLRRSAYVAWKERQEIQKEP
jgi:hypothetical protein